MRFLPPLLWAGLRLVRWLALGLLALAVVVVVGGLIRADTQPLRPGTYALQFDPPTTLPYPSSSASAPAPKLYGPAPASVVAPPPTEDVVVPATPTPPTTTTASGTRTDQSNWCDSFCGEAPVFLGCPAISEEAVDTATLACLAPDGTQNGTAYLAWHRPGMPYTDPPPGP